MYPSSAQVYAPVQVVSSLALLLVLLGIAAITALAVAAKALGVRRSPRPLLGPRPPLGLYSPLGPHSPLAPRPQTVAPYRLAASLLTPTEAAFYQELRAAVGPMAVIQCKVRLADILLAPERDLKAFRQVSQKHVDFLLCERVTLRPLVAVELDDRSHDRADRRERDAFVDKVYAQAGLPLLHVPVQSEYQPAALLCLLQPLLVSSA